MQHSCVRNCQYDRTWCIDVTFNDRERESRAISVPPRSFSLCRYDTCVAMKSPSADQSERVLDTLEIARQKESRPEIINEMSQYTAEDIIYIYRDYYRDWGSTGEFNDTDRSLRLPLLKGDSQRRDPRFFPFRAKRHESRPRSGKKTGRNDSPVRTLLVASVLRICIWSGLSYTLARHSFFLPACWARFFPLPFSLVSTPLRLV